MVSDSTRRKTTAMDVENPEHVIRELETALWMSATRFDLGFMERVLAQDFEEIGCSGRAYSRAQILAMPEGAINAVLPLQEFAVRKLGDGVLQARYVSEVDGVRCRRSSIWIADGETWRLRFHQGTRMHAEVDEGDSGAH